MRHAECLGVRMAASSRGAEHEQTLLLFTLVHHIVVKHEGNVDPRC